MKVSRSATLKQLGRHSPQQFKTTVMIICFAMFLVSVSLSRKPYCKQSSSVVTTELIEDKGRCRNGVLTGPGVPTFKTRDDLGKVIEGEHNFTRGVELGVQRGLYSKTILSQWTSCNEYHLVDIWAHQENYKDIANVNQDKQNEIYDSAMKNVDQWKEKIHVCRNYTTHCALLYDDDYFDFIYVDARHDFKGVYLDISDWWKKLKVGGIMSGHDYVTQDDGPSPRQDWTKNFDGTIDETGTVVKGAVDKFASEVCRQVTVSYREKEWNTWAIRK